MKNLLAIIFSLMLISPLAAQKKKVTAILNKAKKATETNDWTTASNLSRKAMELDADNAEGHGLLAISLLNLDSAAIALEHFSIFFQLNPENKNLLLFRGIALCRLKRLEEAEPDLKVGLEIFPNSGVGWIYMGMLNWAKGDFILAGKAFDKALSLEPDNLDFRLQRARFAIKVQDYPLAIRDAEFILSRDPGMADAFSVLGDVYAKMGRYEKAAQYYQRQGALMKNQTGPLVNESSVWFYAGKPEKAKQLLLKALELDSTEIGACTMLSLAYHRSGEIEKALEFGERAIRLDSTNIEALNNYGYVLSQVGMYEKAEQVFLRQTRLDPLMAFGWNNLGFAKFKQGQWEEGLKDMEYSLELDPFNSYAFFNIARVWLERGEKEKACEALGHALRLGFSEMYGKEAADLKAQNCH